MKKYDSTHTGYSEWVERYAKVRAACSGQQAVRELGEKVLPKLNGHDDKEYRAYLHGALYTNYTGRTLEGLLGMVFRKDPAQNFPAGFELVADDVDLKGNSVSILAQSVLSEVMQAGSYGMLVEYPQAPAEQMSQAQAEALNIRPYVSCYRRESIIDWRMDRVNNSYQPVMIKLKETHTEWVSEFESKDNEQIRMLLLLEGVYLQRVYRKMDKDWVQIGDDIIPQKQGRPLTFIPFWVFGRDMGSLGFQEPLLEDLADVNLAHYRTSASYERGCVFTGAPTPILAGFILDENERVKLGSTTAICTQDPNAKWGYLEFTGQGLDALVNSMKMKEAQMAALGARMLAPEKTGVEAQGTLEMRTNGESSVLAMMAKLVSQGFVQMLEFMAEWQGVGREIEFALNTDYLPRRLTAQELKELVSAYLSGAISKQDFFWNLQQGELVRDGQSFNDYDEETQQTGLGEM